MLTKIIMIDEQLDITNLCNRITHNNTFYDKITNNETITSIHKKFTMNIPSSIELLPSDNNHDNQNDLIKAEEQIICDEQIINDKPIIEEIKQKNIITIEAETQTEYMDVFNKKMFKTCIISGICANYTNKHIFIDNSNDNNIIELGNGNEKEIREIYQLYKNMFSTQVNTCNGSFYLDSHNTSKKLFYINDVIKWKIIGTKNNQFFPSLNINHFCSNNSCSGFGSSVSMSGDGLVYVIGSFLDNNCVGSVFVYKNNERINLIGNNNIGTSFQGISVSTNFNGSIISIGGSGDNDGIGACWVFENNNRTKLIGSSSIGQSHQGITNILSLDGKYLFVGGSHDDENNGAVWIFNNLKEELKLCGKNKQYFGSYLSTNRDGSIIVIGETNNIHIFVHDCEKWNLSQTISNINVSSLSLNPNGCVLLFSYKNSLNIMKLKNNKYIKKNIINQEQEIVASCMSENGKTIFICCVTNNNKIIGKCLTIKEKKYVLQNTYDLDYTNISLSLPLSMSCDGKYVLIGSESFNNYNGECLLIN